MAGIRPYRAFLAEVCVKKLSIPARAKALWPAALQLVDDAVFSKEHTAGHRVRKTDASLRPS